MPFNSTCEALGVVLDLSESSSALAKVYNTQSRVQKSSRNQGRNRAYFGQGLDLSGGSTKITWQDAVC